MKKPYHIVTRTARESAAVIEQFGQSNGLLLPIVNLIESASQVVETVLHEIRVHSLEAILVLSAEQLAGARVSRRSAHSLLPSRSGVKPTWVGIRNSINALLGHYAQP